MEMKLYEINEALRTLLETGWVVDTETGELLFEGPEGLDQLEMARTDKVLALGAVIKETRSQLEAFEKERTAITKRLQSRSNQLQRKLDWLGGYLRENIGDDEKFKDTFTSIYWMRTKSVELAPVAPESLPDQFKRVKVEPDRVALKKALEAGDASAREYGQLVENKSIVVR